MTSRPILFPLLSGILLLAACTSGQPEPGNDSLVAIADREGNFETADYLRSYFRKKSKM